MKKGTNKDILNGFEASPTDAEYLTPPGQKIAVDEINESGQWDNAVAQFAIARSLLQDASYAHVQLGHILLLLRVQYAGDKQFGQARQKHLPEMSTRWCSQLMAVARDPILSVQEGVNISTLIELLPADKDTKTKVIADPPTVKETRKIVKESKKPTPKPVHVPTVEDIICENMQSDLQERIEVFTSLGKSNMNDEWCWFILGISPYFEDKHAPNAQVMEELRDIARDASPYESATKAIDAAMNRIRKYYRQEEK